MTSSIYEGNNLNETLSFNSCNIYIDRDVDLGDGKYNLKTITFNGARIICEDDPTEGMSRIVEAISNSQLKASLRQIEVFECNVKKSDVAKLLKIHELSHVRV